jgi:hypothetical protein
MMSLSLAMMMLAAAAPPAASEPPPLCQSDLPRVEGRVVAWYNLLLDHDYRPMSSEVFMRTDFDAAWRIDGGTLGRPGAMTYFYASLRMPARPQEPVTLTVVPDPGTRPRPPHFSSIVTPRDVGRGEWEVVASEKQVPNIFGKRVTLIVTDGGGREVVRRELTHPAWAWFETETAKAGRAAEVKRLRRECVPSAVF